MRALMIVSALLLLAACTTQSTSNPTRSATEELLISAAADRAAAGLSLSVPYGSKVFVDAANFDTPDGKYAVSSIRQNILLHNMKLVEKRDGADVVIEVRAGALSTNQNETLVGIPSFAVPVPLASGALTVPELALYKDADQEGIARFSATAFGAKDGAYIADAEPQFGFSHDRKQTAFFIFTWTSNDILPKDYMSRKVESITK